MKSKTIVHVVGTVCPPEKEAEFDRWYNETHVPDLMKFKKLKGVTRLKKLHGDLEYPVFLIFYEFETDKDYQDYIKSPERAEAGGEWARVQKELGAGRKWSVQYEVIKSWKQ
jgi:hypothetical protein